MLLAVMRFNAGLECGDDQRSFGRIANDLPGIGIVTARADRRVVAPRGGGQNLDEVDFIAWIDRIGLRWFQFPGFQELSVRCVAAARHLKSFAAGHDLAHGHFVAGQSPRLVRTNDRHGAERFDARQLADEGVAFDHPLQA